MTAEASQKARRLSLAHWAAGRFDEASQQAWAAYRLAPDDQRAKALLARILHRFWRNTGSETRADLIQLLQDRNIDPGDVSLAGWFVALCDPSWQGASKYEDFANLAAYVENDELCRMLLQEAPVYLRPVEYLLTKVRRWLLVSSAWRRYPQLTEALIAPGGAQRWRLAIRRYGACAAEPRARASHRTCISSGSRCRTGVACERERRHGGSRGGRGL